MDATRTGRWPWRTFTVLLVAALLGVLAIFPYALSLQQPMLRDLGVQLPPLWLLIIAQSLQTMVLVAGAVALGLWLGPKVGLGVPLLTELLAGDARARPRLRAQLPPAAGLGVLIGVVIVVLDVVVFSPLAGETDAGTQPPLWQGLLASFYGGIVEEILLRLGLMTLIAWVGVRLSRARTPSAIVIWISITVTAVLFGVGHLPTAAALGALTTLVVVRVVVLNSLGGLVFGWLYARRGLLPTMTAHFCADLVLHVLAPLVVLAVSVPR